MLAIILKLYSLGRLNNVRYLAQGLVYRKCSINVSCLIGINRINSYYCYYSELVVDKESTKKNILMRIHLNSLTSWQLKMNL